MAEFDIKAIFKIEGLQGLQKAFKGISSAANQVGKDFKAFTGAVSTTAKNVAKVAAVATGAVGAVVALTKVQAEAAEATLNLSKQTGLSTDAIQKYSQIAEDAGVGSEAMVKGVQQLNRRLLDLKDPTSSAGKDLKSLDAGLAASIKTAKNTDEAFLIAKTRLGEISDETKRANIEFLLFGKAGTALDPVLSQNNQEFEKLSASAKNFGVVLTPLQLQSLALADEGFDNLQKSISGLTKGFTAVLAPAVAEATNAFTTFLVTNRQAFLDFVARIATQAIPVIRDFFRLLSGGPEVENVNATAKRIYDNFISIKDAVFNVISVAQAGFNTLATIISPIAAFFGMSGSEFLITAAILQLIGVFKILTTGASLFLSSFKLVMVAFKSAPTIIGVLLQILGKLQFILPILTTGVRLLWVAFTGPIGLVIAGLTLLGVVIFKIIDQTIGWKKALELLGQFFVFLGQLALKVLGDILNVILSIPTTIGKIIASVITMFVSFFASLFNIVTTQIAKIAIAIGGVLLAAFDKLKAAIGSVVQFALQKGKEIFDGIVNSVKNAITNLVGILANTIKSIFNSVKSTIDSIIGGIVNTINKVRSTISSVVSAVTGSGNQKKVTTTTSIPAKADGGLIGGAGTGTSDSNLIWGSRGEFMIQAKAVRKFGVDFFRNLNSGILPAIRGFADGGLIGGLDSLAAAAVGNPMSLAVPVASANSQANLRPLHLHLPDGRVIKTNVDNNTARNLERSMRRSDNAKAARLPGWYQ